MKKVLNLAMYLVVASLLFVSCSDDDNDSIPNVSVNGIYVLNEGSTNGSVSFIDKTSGEVTQNYFESVNGLPLGKYPQSMAFSDEYAFVVVTTASGAGYVEVVTASDFKHFATIEGLSYPREIAIDGDKAYVSNGTGATGSYPNYIKQNNEIHVIDLNTMQITSEISVGAGPEKMVISKGKLYVANSGGYSNDDKTVSVIDVNTNAVIKTIIVKSCPKDMAVDANGNVWVYCGGVPDYTSYPYTYTDAGISKIDGDGNVTSYDLTNISTSGLKNLCVSRDKKTIYFMSDAVYAMDYKATSLPTEKFLDKTFYGIDVNPENGNIWCCSATYGQAGEVVVHDEDAMELKSFAVGIMPNSTIFKH